MGIPRDKPGVSGRVDKDTPPQETPLQEQVMMLGKGSSSAQPRPDVAVLCDFDGTATPHIAIDMLYREFGSPACLEITQRWERCEISTPEEIQSCFATITASRTEMETFLASLSLDPGLPDLVSLCRQQGYRFAIVSDGLTWYINYILNRHDIHDVTIYANEIHFGPDGFRFSFPWYRPETPLRGTSKPTIVRRYQAEGAKVVFIGDGLTDVQAAEAADVVYARAGLWTYCREHHIPAIEFSDLADLLTKWTIP